MNLEELRTLCLSMPKVTEDIKWENHLCFSVGSKMFIITAPDEVPVSASFKTNDDDFEKLTAKLGFIPAPYLAKNKWVRVDDIGRLSHKQWKELMQQAYDIIFEKLTGKLKKEILGGSSDPIKKTTKKISHSKKKKPIKKAIKKLTVKKSKKAKK